MKNFASGQCLCGEIKYSISKEPIRMAQCHCVDCQKATGTGHVSQAFFEDEAVSIQGQAATYATTADSGNINTRHFCSSCGSRLFSTNSGRSGIIGVAAGSFDESNWFKPQVVLYTDYKKTWDLTSEEVPNFPRMPS